MSAKIQVEPSVKLTTKYFEAVQYASEQHAKQVRKSTAIPYISHPLGVSSLILEAGGDEELAIAGLLHDVPEDCGGEPRLAEIKAKFGSRVEAIVRGCSDAIPFEGEIKQDWKYRKEKHLRELYTSHHDVLLVTAADKTHNARAIATDLDNIGAAVWERFNANSDEIIWYYDAVCELLQSRRISSTLLSPLIAAIGKMKRICNQME